MTPDIYRAYATGSKYARDRHIELKINSNVADGAGSREARDRYIELKINSNVAYGAGSRDPDDRHRKRGAPSTFAPTPPAPARYEVHNLPHSMRTIALLASAVGNCTVNVPAVETLSVPKSSTATEGLPAAVEL